MEYIAKDDTIIFGPEFNKSLDYDLISRYKKIIFSNYILNDTLFKKSKYNKNQKRIFIRNHKYISNEFNQPVNNFHSTNCSINITTDRICTCVSNSITHIIFGSKFNQEVDELPENLTNLIFGYNFDKKVNNLPKKLTHLIFDFYFNQKVDTQ